jgi:micrococcal nuclease
MQDRIFLLHVPDGGTFFFLKRMRRVKIARVIDGDTIVDTTGLHYRLYGIDTPEKRQDYGSQSTDALRLFLAQYNSVVYVQEHGFERNHRMLATFYTSPNPDQDLQNLNYMLVVQGHAWVYRIRGEEKKRGAPIRPTLDQYVLAETNAREQGRGLWAYRNPERPHDYRKRMREKHKRKV